MASRSRLVLVPLAVVLVLGLALVGCASESATTRSLRSSAGGNAAGSGNGGNGATVPGPILTSTTVGGISSTTTTMSRPAGDIPSRMAVRLSGDQQVPPVRTEAHGTFILLVSLGSTSDNGGPSTLGTVGGGGLLLQNARLSYRLEVENLEDASAAHIHLGAKGRNGGVIYSLFSGPQKNGEFTGVLAEGLLRESDLTGSFRGKSFADLIEAVLQGETYVNIHTAADPDGAIRGQILVQAETPAVGSGAGSASSTPTTVGVTSASGTGATGH